MTSENTSEAIPVPASGGRPEAAAAVWSPRLGDSEPGGGDVGTGVRRRALIEAAVAAGVGALLYLWHPRVAFAAWGLAAVVLAAALLSPGGLYAGIRRVAGWLGHAAGQVITVVLLVPLFLVFFAPFGAFFRRGRRDRMEPRFDRAAPSYWKKRRPAGEATAADYERMF